MASEEPPDSSAITRMLSALRHRGPDEAGAYVDRCCALGNVRLSIIDLENGRQPISNERGTHWIVFNGEVFNHAELRDELRRAGHVFTTTTDTEVILHLYEDLGPDCLRRLNGDFAIAIWNSEDRELFLARDRVGVRPLFYTLRSGQLVFASEIKALVAAEAIDPELDPLALDQIFTYWSPLSPRTPFTGVFEIPPGHCATVRDGILKQRRYWQLEFSEDISANEEVIEEELARLLADAVRLRLRADVPVGAYVSGGLDSSIIAAIARQECGITPDSFSISFEDQRFDESSAQAAAARLLGTRHHVVHAEYRDIAECFPSVVRHAETPLLRTGPGPMFLLSRLVQQSGLKVVLTGEGADEFFAGYDIFKEAAIRRFCASQPGSNRRGALFQRLKENGAAASSPAMLQAFYGAHEDDVDSASFSHQVRWRNTSRSKRFFGERMKGTLRSPAPGEPFGWTADSARWSPLARAQYLEASIFLPNYLLSSQGDRPAMAHSVEGRYPFLDHRVIEFAGRVPARLKLRALLEKYILRKTAARWLPADQARRPKRPYTAPILDTFFGPTSPDYVRALLEPSAIAQAGYFNPAAVAALTRRIAAGARIGETDQMALAGILSTQLWHDCFISRRLNFLHKDNNLAVTFIANHDFHENNQRVARH